MCLLMYRLKILENGTAVKKRVMCGFTVHKNMKMEDSQTGEIHNNDKTK